MCQHRVEHNRNKNLKPFLRETVCLLSRVSFHVLGGSLSLRNGELSRSRPSPVRRTFSDFTEHDIRVVLLAAAGTFCS